MTTVRETNRIALRHFTLDDADVMLAVLNDPGFLRYVGDRGVRTVDDARRYLTDRILASYEQHGFGMYVAVRTADGERIGVCGLVRRDGLDDADVGYALLPAFRGQGYAHACAAATLEVARDLFDMPRVVAIVSPDNAASIRVLESVGMTHEDTIRLTPESPDVLLYAISLGQRST